jgi:hypothetical protein
MRIGKASTKHKIDLPKALEFALYGASKQAGHSGTARVLGLFDGLPIGEERGPFYQSWIHSRDSTPVDTSITARFVEIKGDI